MTLSHDETVQAAAAWLLNSGIQNPQKTRDIQGADVGGSFNAWFNPQTQGYAYIYTEISGYALTTLLYLWQETTDTRYKDSAIRLGEWLLTVQHSTGAFPTALYLTANSHQKPGEFHSFDVGMVLNGLVCLYRHVPDERFLQAAIRAADWILHIQQPDGSLAAMVDVISGQIKDHPGTWSTQSGPYHAKLAIGLLHLFEVTKKPAYLQATRALCDYSLTRQTPEGQFLTYGDLNGTNLHPHAYACEGLYVAGAYLHEPRYTEASRRGTVWALSLGREGLVPRHKHEDTLNYHERVDILAQISRLATLHELAHPSSQELLARLPTYQSHAEPLSQHGGFIFGKSSAGDVLPHINAWVTMFALQALKVAEKKDPSSFDPFYVI